MKRAPDALFLNIQTIQEVLNIRPYLHLSILFSAYSTKILDFTDFAEQLISYIYLQNRVFWI